MSQHHISAQLKRFLITGVSATLVDLVCYSAFLFVGTGFITAKTGSFLCAVTFAYLGHKNWTFMTHGSSSRMAAFAALYICALIINNAVNLTMLDIFGTEVRGIAIAFVIATGVTASINFTVMKFLIFKPAEQPESDTYITEE